MKVLFILLFVQAFIIFDAKTQSITPFTLNIAAFSSIQNGYALTISTGETVSIVDFKAPTGLGLSSGFLQNNPPLVTAIQDVNTHFNSNEIRISPNPVETFTHIYSNFNIGGLLQYQIINIDSKIIFRSPVYTTYGSMHNEINFSNFPSGHYFIHVYFKTINGKIISGIYKIIKL